MERAGRAAVSPARSHTGILVDARHNAVEGLQGVTKQPVEQTILFRDRARLGRARTSDTGGDEAYSTLRSNGLARQGYPEAFNDSIVSSP